MKSTRKILISSICLFALYTGTATLAYATTDQWVAVTPPATSGYVFNATATVGDYVYIGTDHGVYKSADGGTSWSQVNTGLGSTLNITSIAIGATYNSGTGTYVVTSPSLVFVGTSNGGIFKSTIGGTSWTAVNTGLSDSNIIDLKIDQSQATQGSFTDIYAATPSGVFRSSDLGANWHLENSGVSGTPKKLTTDFINQKIYLITSGNKIYSTNLFSVSSATLSWSQIFDASGTTTNSISMLNTMGAIGWLATSQGIYKSDSAGTAWASTSVGLPASSVNNISSDYYDSNVAYASVPSYGVYRTTDEGIPDGNPLTAEWLPINIGLTDLNIIDVETNPATSTTLYALSQSALFKLTYSATPIKDIDLTPPSTVNDLLASYDDTDTVELSWTSPGGDAEYGTATYYEIRYSTSLINSSNFSAATPVVPQPTPSGHGYSELYFVHGLDLSHTYYFALKSSDGSYGGPALNVSSLSNVASFALAPHTIGGTVSGMSGTLILRNNGSNDLTVSSDGLFTFSTPVYTGYSYAVTVYTNPVGYSCSITHGSGTITGPDITDVAVSCVEVDTTSPTVTGFSIPPTSSSPTVSVTFTATDNVGVTGYLITESASIPSASNPGWSSSAQTSYTFSSAGVKTLYAWAKDLAGNISTSLNDSVTITGHTIGGTTSGLTGTAVLLNNGGDNLSVSGNTSFTFATSLYAGQSYNVTVYSTPVGYGCSVTNASGTTGSSDITNISVACTTDTTPPTITAFIASRSSTATIAISSFSATDDTSVSGYLITESAITPSSLDNGWSITPQTTYTTSGPGTFTLYAWAKDSSGQISSAVTQTVTDTLADSSAPTAPTGLTATAVSSSQIDLVWIAATDNIAVTSYKVYRNSILIATVGGLSYSDTGLTASYPYAYYVIAYDGAGNPSPQGSTASTTTQAVSSVGGGTSYGGGSSGGGGGGGGGGGESSYTLTVSRLGLGFGSITSLPLPGILCGLTCVYSFPNKTNITLTASPQVGSYVSAWGGCLSFTKTTCTIVLSSNLTVSVTFAMGTSTAEPLLAQIQPANVALPLIPGIYAALRVGSKSSLVTGLQKFLNEHGAIISPTGAGSPGKESDYYGALTDVAVKKYILMVASASPGTGSTTVPTVLAANYPYRNTVFKIGAKNPEVKTLQTYLSGKGYMPKTSITGYYGLVTDVALKKYKADMTLRAYTATSIPLKPLASALPATIPAFSRELSLNSRGTDVRNLQRALNAQGFPVATTGTGSPGKESDVFGPATKAAVIRFQEAHATLILKPAGLTKGTGVFGKATIKVLNSMIGY